MSSGNFHAQGAVTSANLNRFKQFGNVATVAQNRGELRLKTTGERADPKDWRSHMPRL